MLLASVVQPSTHLCVSVTLQATDDKFSIVLWRTYSH